MHSTHAAASPVNYGFDVVVSRLNNVSKFELDPNSHEQERNRHRWYIIIRAIVYTEPSSGQWKVLAESSKAHFTINPALQEFTKDLEREIGTATGM